MLSQWLQTIRYSKAKESTKTFAKEAVQHNALARAAFRHPTEEDQETLENEDMGQEQPITAPVSSEAPGRWNSVPEVRVLARTLEPEIS